MGYYYLLRNQHYGEHAQFTVYRSKDPLDFGQENTWYPVETMRRRAGDYRVRWPVIPRRTAAESSWHPDRQVVIRFQGEALMKTMKFLAVTALLLAAIPACAESTTATLTGTVTDASGAVIAGVHVTVINHETHVVAWDGVSNASGNYVAPEIPVGTYDITAEQRGFKKTKIDNVALAVDERATVNPVLQPGDIVESVTIDGGAATIHLETSYSSISTRICPTS